MGEQLARCSTILGLLEMDDNEESSLAYFASVRDYYVAHPASNGVGAAAKVNHFLGLAELNLGNYALARDYYLEALSYFEEVGNLGFVAFAKLMLASVELITKNYEECARHAISAAVLFDQLYYRLRRFDDRRHWAQRNASALDLALRVSLLLGDKRRVVELIESARAQAVPVGEVNLDKRKAAMGIFLTGMLDDPSTLGPPSEIVRQAGVELLDEPLGPPHGITLEHSGPSLAESVRIDLGKLHEGQEIPDLVSIKDMVTLVGGQGAYWFGSYASDGVLYWFLLGPDTEIEVGRVEMDSIDPYLSELKDSLPNKYDNESGDAFKGRLSQSSLLIGEKEEKLAYQLGQLLLPESLRDLLATRAEGTPISLVIAPAVEIAMVPFGWLAVDEHNTRVIEGATIMLGASLGLLYDASTKLSPPGDGSVLGVVDPVGDLLGVKRPHRLNIFINDLRRIGSGGLLSNPRNQKELNTKGPASKTNFLDFVQSNKDASILLYVGHITRGESPASAAMVLADQGATESLFANEIFADPTLSIPSRVLLIACGGSEMDSKEWHGIAPAMVFAGARLVLGAQWSLIWDLPDSPFLPTAEIAIKAAEALLEPDPIAAFRQLQLDALNAFRLDSSDIANSPLFWSGISPMGFAGKI
ncbi:MAG: CHAT domain-containing protein [Ferrimicrobium acidiphilum]